MPARLRDIARVAAEHGISLETATKGSHWRFRGPDGLMYPVAAHNGLKSEIDDKYISGLCRCFGLIRSEFRRKL